MPPSQPINRLYREKDLCILLGVTRTTLSRWRKTGEFPNPIKLGPKVSVWPAESIHAWLESKMRMRGTTPYAKGTDS